MIREFGLIDVMYLIAAARWTIALTAVAFAGSAVLGLGLAILRILPLAPLRWFAATYIQLVQGTPLLVWLFLIFFGLPLAGISVNPWIAAAVAFSVYGSAFLGEIWRGAIQAVPRGQCEAADALGLPARSRMVDVIMPQAFKLSLPATVGFLVQLLKGTSLAAIVGFIELTRAGTIVSNQIYRPLLVFGVVGAMYFALCWPLSLWGRRLEQKMAAATAK